MTWFSKAAAWAGKNAGTIAKVALPIAGFAAGLLVPSVGNAIGKLADKVGNKVSDLTGIGDGKPGIFGIGDKLPGLLGIGTGKAKEALIAAAVKRMKELTSKSDKTDAEKQELETQKKIVESAANTGTDEEKAAAKEAVKDMKKEGVSPLLLIGGGLLAFLALGKR